MKKKKDEQEEKPKKIYFDKIISFSVVFIVGGLLAFGGSQLSNYINKPKQTAAKIDSIEDSITQLEFNLKSIDKSMGIVGEMNSDIMDIKERVARIEGMMK